METMVNFVMYDSSNGALLRTGISQQETLALEETPPGGVLLEGVIADLATEYIDIITEEVIPRPVMGTSLDVSAIDADGVDEATISAIANGASLHLSSNDAKLLYDAVISDGEFVLTTESAGSYTVTITLFPYIQEVHTIVAT